MVYSPFLGLKGALLHPYFADYVCTIEILFTLWVQQVDVGL